MTNFFFLSLKKNKNKKKGKDEKYGSELTTPENSSSPGMMDMHGGWWDAVVGGGVRCEVILSLGTSELTAGLRFSADDNSNQSSIADSSPVKQENSCSTSPTPDPAAASHRERSEAKSDQSPDSKRGEPRASAPRLSRSPRSRSRGRSATSCLRHCRLFRKQQNAGGE